MLSRALYIYAAPTLSAWRASSTISLVPAAPTPTTSGYTPGDDADYLLDEPFALIAEEVRELASASQGEFRSPQPL